jgi:hypothetical protein
MTGAIAVLLGFILLPGSVIMLLSANFGLRKGYLIGGVSFFGFLFLLSLIWTFGVPGTPALTGPVGPAPTFKQFTKDSPEAQRFDAVNQFQGRAGNGWEAIPSAADNPELNEELTAAQQSSLNVFINEYNEKVEESNKEVDVINLKAETFYVEQDGTEVAATVISPADPPDGSGLERPNFQPTTEFAWRDPGFPNLFNYIFVVASLLLTALHLLLLARAERRSPLGPVSAPTPAENVPAPVGARR